MGISFWRLVSAPGMWVVGKSTLQGTSRRAWPSFSSLPPASISLALDAKNPDFSRWKSIDDDPAAQMPANPFPSGTILPAKSFLARLLYTGSPSSKPLHHLCLVFITNSLLAALLLWFCSLPSPKISELKEAPQDGSSFYIWMCSQEVSGLASRREKSLGDRALTACRGSAFQLRTDGTLGKLEASQHARLFLTGVSVLIFLEDSSTKQVQVFYSVCTIWPRNSTFRDLASNLSTDGPSHAGAHSCRLVGPIRLHLTPPSCSQGQHSSRSKLLQVGEGHEHLGKPTNTQLGPSSPLQLQEAFSAHHWAYLNV